MRKIFLLFLVPVFMFNSSLSELFKLPMVFTHYEEHQKLDQDLSLLDFLSMHYLGTDFDNNDNDREEKLPFKNLSAPTPFQAISVDAAELFFIKRAVFPETTSHLSDFRRFNLLNPHSQSLFRPPVV